MKNQNHWIKIISLVLTAALMFSASSESHTLEHEAHTYGHSTQQDRGNTTTELFLRLGKNATWTQAGQVKMNGWTTHHTQGLIKIGEYFYVSSVEILEGTERTGGTTDALYDASIDRSAGKGRGWLTKFDTKGKLIAQVELSDGDIYHPGGIDFDGKNLWVPVAEYRPNSHSNVFRVDPVTLKAELVFQEDDHIGGVVYNRHRGTVHGISWGSRRLYTWQEQHHKQRDKFFSSSWEPNPAFYIDLQDCHYQGIEYMLCGGVGSYSTPRGSIAFGGLELFDLKDGRPVHQIPVPTVIDEGNGADPTLSLSHNAFWAEPGENGVMRIYFMAERDNQADLLIYNVEPWFSLPR